VTLKHLCGVWCLILLLVGQRRASAQVFEDIGTRAQGMGGAFVALADDATATWWNPAGLATGSYFSGVIERDFAKAPNEGTGLGVAFAVPSLGISYYRVRVGAAAPSGSTESAAPGRQDPGTAIAAPSFVVSQIGATFGQSIAGHLVLASTLKLVRADNTSGDLDIGLMARFGSLRAGAVVKHLQQPDVIVDGIRVGLDRQVRVGAAYAPIGRQGMTVNATIDADLTTTATAFGNARHLAGGAELWAGKQLGLRTGVSVNTIDDRRASFSVGGSVAVRMGTYLDARITRGDDEVVRGWGFDLRVAF
jgi:hypothetical protein